MAEGADKAPAPRGPWPAAANRIAVAELTY